MRYLYKINSDYDGFRPSRIPQRLRDGRFLELGWARYIDAIHNGDEVWIVFVGRGVVSGVYVEGIVASVDGDAGTVQLRVRRKSTDDPLTDAQTSAQLLAAVSTRYRQVFLWPPHLALRENCGAEECGNRACQQCVTWQSIPQLELAHYRAPAAIRGLTVVPAYWIVPARCYLYRNNRRPAPWNRRVSDMFAAFKVGEKRYTFPLAAGMHAALRARGQADFEAIVPIPLSPEKAAAGEFDRTNALAMELRRLGVAPVRNLLTLTGSISKRRMQAQGFTPTQFKSRYLRLLEVDPAVANLKRVLLVDDVITRGSTLSVAVAALRAINPALDIVVAAAGQMIVMDAVANQNGPAW